MSDRSNPEMVLATITADEPPTLEGAARQLGVDVADLNSTFGVKPIDPAAHQYCVEVRSDRFPATRESSRRYQGPFSNPEIAPFGPVKSDKKDDER
jgi:hypothetical protein